MFGIEDPQVWLAYLLCILSAILCVVYGIRNWNKGEETLYPEDKKWEKTEKEIEAEL